MMVKVSCVADMWFSMILLYREPFIAATRSQCSCIDSRKLECVYNTLCMISMGRPHHHGCGIGEHQGHKVIKSRFVSDQLHVSLRVIILNF